jgi:hypothetical protein
LINHPAGEKTNLSNHASTNTLSLANAFDDYFRGVKQQLKARFTLIVDIIAGCG